MASITFLSGSATMVSSSSCELVSRIGSMGLEESSRLSRSETVEDVTAARYDLKDDTIV